MSDIGLFLAGVAITIPAALGIIFAAIADGRENDRIQTEERQGNGSSSSAARDYERGRGRSPAALRDAS